VIVGRHVAVAIPGKLGRRSRRVARQRLVEDV
jgi:hypothetical protein